MRKDYKKLLVIGSGPIVIGQAAEFDFSGTQACRSLREEGYKTVLVNSNPATIQTDTDTADSVYIEPLLAENVARLADGTIAGSATNLFDCMRNAVRFGIPREDAIRAATWNPARQIHALDRVGSVADGKLADFVICDAELNRRSVWMNGRKVES